MLEGHEKGRMSVDFVRFAKERSAEEEGDRDAAEVQEPGLEG